MCLRWFWPLRSPAAPLSSLPPSRQCHPGTTGRPGPGEVFLPLQNNFQTNRTTNVTALPAELSHDPRRGGDTALGPYLEANVGEAAEVCDSRGLWDQTRQVLRGKCRTWRRRNGPSVRATPPSPLPLSRPWRPPRQQLLSGSRVHGAGSPGASVLPRALAAPAVKAHAELRTRGKLGQGRKSFVGANILTRIFKS